MQIIENPVITSDGYLHPEYPDFEGREWITFDEWKEWLDQENLEDSAHLLEYEDTPFSEAYFEGQAVDLSEWEINKPEGDGWFLGAMFDTEDGPYCV